MSRPAASDAAKAFVAQHYPDALQAWLSGSVVLGRATATSDLDVTVLMEEVAPHRRSLEYRGWPVEVFVHTEASVRHYVAKDLARRRPTMARLVSNSVALLPGTEGDLLRRECADAVAAGPAPLNAQELTMARYTLTDLLDDLRGGADPEVLDLIAMDVWRSTAELHLALNRAWTGTGKWLVRELRQLDGATGDDMTGRLRSGLHNAFSGEVDELAAVADDVLAGAGGRFWVGLRLEAQLPAGV